MRRKLFQCTKNDNSFSLNFITKMMSFDLMMFFAKKALLDSFDMFKPIAPIIIPRIAVNPAVIKEYIICHVDKASTLFCMFINKLYYINQLDIVTL